LPAHPGRFTDLGPRRTRFAGEHDRGLEQRLGAFDPSRSLGDRRDGHALFHPDLPAHYRRG